MPDPDVAGWQGGCNVVGRGLSFTGVGSSQKKASATRLFRLGDSY